MKSINAAAMPSPHIYAGAMVAKITRLTSGHHRALANVNGPHRVLLRAATVNSWDCQ